MDPLTLGIIGVILYIAWPKLKKMLSSMPLDEYIKALDKQRAEPNVYPTMPPAPPVAAPPVAVTPPPPPSPPPPPPPPPAAVPPSPKKLSALEHLQGFAKHLPLEERQKLVKQYAPSLVMEAFQLEEERVQDES